MKWGGKRGTEDGGALAIVLAMACFMVAFPKVGILVWAVAAIILLAAIVQ